MAKGHFVGFERRQFGRVHSDFILDVEEVDLRVELGITKKEEAHLMGKTLNVSAGGILFELAEDVPLGTVLSLKIKIPGWTKYLMSICKTRRLMRSPASFKAIAKVVRNEEIKPNKVYDVGVVFVNIADKHKQALKKYIKDN